MSARRKVEVFSAGCPACKETIELVNRMGCPSCEVTVLDMQDMRIANRAKELGISTVPAVVIDGKLAECCKNRTFSGNRKLRAFSKRKYLANKAV